MSAPQTRRGVLAAMAAVPVLGLATSSAAKSSELERLIAIHNASRDRFSAAGRNGVEASDPSLHEHLENDYLAALDRLDAYEPKTSGEFIRHLAVCFDDYAIPNDDHWLRIIETAKRFASEGSLI